MLNGSTPKSNNNNNKPPRKESIPNNTLYKEKAVSIIYKKKE